MIVPTQVDFATVPNGGVVQDNTQTFWIKVDAGGAVQLANGHYFNAFSGAVVYFPDARLAV